MRGGHREVSIVVGAGTIGAIAGTLLTIVLTIAARRGLDPWSNPMTVAGGFFMLSLPFTLAGSSALSLAHVVLRAKAGPIATNVSLVAGGTVAGGGILFAGVGGLTGGFLPAAVTIGILGAAYGLLTSIAWVGLRQVTRDRPEHEA